ncbi:MAG TPA: aldolase [Firmicutes bacterium]|nr:aldolase [Bacillota bacterium]
MLEEFQRIGRDLFLQGLNSSHSGNMSVRLGDRIIITRRGSSLSNLKEGDLVETGLEKNDSFITLASTEIVVHREIYQKTAALAIVHCHAPRCVALSLLEDEIIPVDSEGSYFFHKIPVVATELTVGSKEAARLLAQVLKNYKVAVLRGHGIFAVGQVLEEAYQYASAAEHVCQIICHVRALDPHYVAKSEYGRW